MGNKQKMIDFAIEWCNDNSHGYDQTNRWGPDCDCSSLMYMAARAGGYSVPTSGTRYTGTMREHFTAAGFTCLPFDGNLSDLDPGDILLNTRDHTEMYIGNGKFAGANINEFGGVAGGKTGDQTGREVYIKPSYNYPWNYVLVPPTDTPTDAWRKEDGSWYFYHNDSKVKGWLLWDGSWFWLDSVTGKMALGWCKCTDRSGTSYRYFKEAGESGRMLEGFQTINGQGYYLRPGWGCVDYTCQRQGSDFDPTKEA